MAYFKKVLILLGLVLLSGCSEFASYTKDALLMDTFVRIEIRDPLPKKTKSLIAERVLARMEKLEKKFNYFADQSELAMINRLRRKEKLLLSDEMFRVLKRAKELSFATRGLFDVTLGEGRSAFRVDIKREAVYFTKDGVKLDLGGIAKGFIVDEGIRLLKKLGVKNALISAGGDMYCMGEGPWGGGWRVGIRNPRNSRDVMETLVISDKGVATSGGYERFTKKKGESVSHIINPRTGRPVKEIFKSVTVVADDCMTADALATALYILEPEEALLLIKRVKGAVCFVVDEDGRMHMSSGVPVEP